MEDKMTEEEKDALIASLKSSEVTVKFKKVSGDERTMRCTLQESVIPPATKEDPLSQKKVRAVSPEVCSVWDIEAAGWRSFRWENIISVE
jgi:hypothetical protein